MSSRNGRQLHLLAFGNVRAGGAWRLPGVRNGPANQLNTLVATAKAAEAASSTPSSSPTVSTSGRKQPGPTNPPRTSNHSRPPPTWPR